MSENEGSRSPQSPVPTATEASSDPDFDRDVFISYAFDDAPLANAFVLGLERNSLTCWIAPRDVVPGTLYADGIIRAITGSKVFVLVLSQHAIASKHVGKEVERAASKGRPIVTLRADIAPLTRSLEYFLSESQWIDVESGCADVALAKVVIAIRRHIAAEHSTYSTTRSIPTAIGASVGNPSAGGKLRHTGRAIALAVFVGLLSLVAVYLGVEGLNRVRHKNAGTPIISPPMAPAWTLSTKDISDKSVAVLPFVDMSEKKDQEYFSDGMSEELINRLAKIPGWRVPARTSAFYFKGKATTVTEIARALSVAYVLEGSVRKSRKMLRVTAQLIRADSGYDIWSETYDRPASDVFKVQDDVAAAVVKALQISLTDGAVTRGAGTQNAESYNLYLQARSIWLHKNGQSDSNKVIDYLRRSLVSDPRFVSAWTLLSNALGDQADFGYADREKALAEARSAAQRAIEIDPQSADAHLAMHSILLFQDWNFTAAEAQLQLALALEPKNQWAMGAATDLAIFQGRPDIALEFARRGVEYDPVNHSRYGDLGAALYVSRRYPEALQAFRKALDLNPNREGVHMQIGFALFASGDPLAALAEFDQDGVYGESCICRVLVYDALGRKAEADATYARLLPSQSGRDAYDVALVHAGRGDLDEAFKWFDVAFHQHEGSLLWIKTDPVLKNVQSDSRYFALLAKIGLPN